jgi:hypothetical protein
MHKYKLDMSGVDEIFQEDGSRIVKITTNGEPVTIIMNCQNCQQAMNTTRGLVASVSTDSDVVVEAAPLQDNQCFSKNYFYGRRGDTVQKSHSIETCTLSSEHGSRGRGYLSGSRGRGIGRGNKQYRQ